MREREFQNVCYRTEQRDESVALRNMKSGQVGYSFGCTMEGNTVQVKLENGELDSWSKADCREEIS